MSETPRERRIVYVQVPFSEAEYRRFARKRAWTAEGLTSSVIREALMLHGIPQGFRLGHRKVTERQYLDEVGEPQ